MQIPTVEQILESLPFKNVATAMDRVFPEGWMVEDIYPDLPGLDFVARFTVRGYGVPIYIHAMETHTTGMYAHGPGGFITVSVPWSGPGHWRTPDGTYVRGVTYLIGTTEEKDRFYGGVSGSNADGIESYFGILRRYLDGPTLEHEEPTIEQIRKSLAFNNVVAAMDRVFPDGWVVQDTYADGSDLDFVARFSVTGYNSPIYINAANTGTSARHGSGPGGRVHISVPWSGPSGWLAPDGAKVRAVKMLAGTAEEKKSFVRGADGASVDEIEAYLRFLRRYLDEQTCDVKDTPGATTNTRA